MVGLHSGPSLIDSLLIDQQQTLVAKFASWHDGDESATHHSSYRDLIPLSQPQAGQQYAFEVDLDACSGCKSCVAACHALNGLEEDESWRSVGLLHGGTNQLPVIQHVTTACHHCLEPACLDGCPVLAYEKDPVTGIVRHLDDQCIGCQYCILKCPYDVPKYSPQKGIVRKCDMCHGRLAVGEAPACVQSCPNQAIRITLVSLDQVREESEANLFLPGAPEPSYTLPTTVYKTKRPLPRNLLPADYYSVQPQHAHLPLVFMLVLTQMSVGAFVVDQLLAWLPAPASADSLATTRAVHSIAAFVLGLLGLGAATLHLGRPQYAFRSIIGLRTSWLSREILAFGVFALLSTLYAALPWLVPRGAATFQRLNTVVGLLVGASGVAGVFCSAMIYASTRRPFWSMPQTTLKFFLTSAVLGLPLVLLIWFTAALCLSELTVNRVMADYGVVLANSIVVLTAVKLLMEAVVIAALAHRQLTPLKRTALLLTGELGPTMLQRFAMGLVGGVILPGILAAPYFSANSAGHSPLFVGCVVVMSLLLLVMGELFERYMFFAAVVAPKMPGAPAS